MAGGEGLVFEAGCDAAGAPPVSRLRVWAFGRMMPRFFSPGL
jgi:hypothetical protein